MNSTRETAIHALRVTLVVALALGTTPAAAESGPGTVAKRVFSAAPAQPQTVAKPSGGPQEGIKVHGHWVIEVRNPDGTLAFRTEFDNSLQSQGKNLLSNFLTQRTKPGRWTVMLDNLSGTTKACAGGTFAGTFPGICYVTEPDSEPPTFLGTNVSRGLTATPVFDPSTGRSTVVLSGSVKALQQGAIDRVYTTLGSCDISVAICHVAETGSGNGNVFSFAFVSVPVPGGLGPIPVQQGQTIDVTVTFSFS